MARKTSDAQEADPKFFLQRAEKLPDGLHRILSEQLSAAVDELSSTKKPLDDVVHFTRKSLKKTRSVLRLIRPTIKKAYSRENSRLQRVGRTLSELRDAQALIEAIQKIEQDTHKNGAKDKKGVQEADGAFEDALQLLRDRKKTVVDALQLKGELKNSVEQLKQAKKSLDKLNLKQVDLPVIVKSVEASIQRGKKAFAKANADSKPEAFHECRKRAKDFRYQIAVLAELWPEVLEGYSKSAKELEQLLGEDHNLAVLADVLEQETNGNKDAGRNLRNLRSQMDEKQAKLRKKAMRLGMRLYSEPTKTWRRRLESSWALWEADGETQLAPS